MNSIFSTNCSDSSEFVSKSICNDEEYFECLYLNHLGQSENTILIKACLHVSSRNFTLCEC